MTLVSEGSTSAGHAMIACEGLEADQQGKMIRFLKYAHLTKRHEDPERPDLGRAPDEARRELIREDCENPTLHTLHGPTWSVQQEAVAKLIANVEKFKRCYVKFAVVKVDVLENFSLTVLGKDWSFTKGNKIYHNCLTWALNTLQIASVYYTKGFTFCSLVNYQMTPNAFIEYLRSHPESVQIRIEGLEKLHLDLVNNSYDNALRLFSQALKLRHLSSTRSDELLFQEIFDAMGRHHKDRKNYEQALDCFHQSLEIEKKVPTTHPGRRLDHMADCYRALGQLDKEKELRHQSEAAWNITLSRKSCFAQ